MVVQFLSSLTSNLGSLEGISTGTFFFKVCEGASRLLPRVDPYSISFRRPSYSGANTYLYEIQYDARGGRNLNHRTIIMESSASQLIIFQRMVSRRLTCHRSTP